MEPFPPRAAQAADRLARPSPLDDIPDPAARAILERGLVLAFGPAAELIAGRFAVALTWRGDGAFRVYASDGSLRAVCAGWCGVSAAALAAVAEHAEASRAAGVGPRRA